MNFWHYRKHITRGFIHNISFSRVFTEVENNVTRILDLIRSQPEGQGKEKPSKASKKEKELIDLVETVYKEYESLYALCNHFIANSKNIVGENEKKQECYSDLGSDVEYFSSDEIEISDIKSGSSDDRVVELRFQLTSMDKENEALKLECNSALTRVKEVEMINGELKAELDKKGREVSGLVTAKESANRQLLDRIKELEAQLLEKSSEAIQLEETNKGLRSLSLELDLILKEKEGQYCVLLKKLEEDERHLESRIEEFDAQERNMTPEIDSLRVKVSELEVELENLLGEVGELDDQNKELEAQLERKNTEIDSLHLKICELEEELENILGEVEKLEDKNTKLEGQKEEHTTYPIRSQALDEEVMDSTLQINNSEECSDGSDGKKTQTENQNNSKLYVTNRDKPNPQIVQRKMEEMVEKFRIGFEDKLRLLSQRILITEQLHYDAKESYKAIVDRYKRANKGLEEKIVGDFKKMKYVSESARYALVTEFDFFVRKFEEENENFSNRISRVSIELKVAKRWVYGATNEIKRLKHNVDCLVAYLEHKEEQEVLLRDKIWKLEAKVSKESGERLNMVQEISQLEKKLAKNERLTKEKDDRILSLGEEKIEAIRQLCVSIDYYRNRVDHLKTIISTMR